MLHKVIGIEISNFLTDSLRIFQEQYTDEVEWIKSMSEEIDRVSNNKVWHVLTSKTPSKNRKRQATTTGNSDAQAKKSKNTTFSDTSTKSRRGTKTRTAMSPPPLPPARTTRATRNTKPADTTTKRKPSLHSIKCPNSPLNRSTEPSRSRLKLKKPTAFPESPVKNSTPRSSMTNSTNTTDVPHSTQSSGNGLISNLLSPVFSTDSSTNTAHFGPTAKLQPPVISLVSKEMVSTPKSQVSKSSKSDLVSPKSNTAAIPAKVTRAARSKAVSISSTKSQVESNVDASENEAESQPKRRTRSKNAGAATTARQRVLQQLGDYSADEMASEMKDAKQTISHAQKMESIVVDHSGSDEPDKVVATTVKRRTRSKETSKTNEKAAREKAIEKLGDYFETSGTTESDNDPKPSVSSNKETVVSIQSSDKSEKSIVVPTTISIKRSKSGAKTLVKSSEHIIVDEIIAQIEAQETSNISIIAPVTSAPRFSHTNRVSPGNVQVTAAVVNEAISHNKPNKSNLPVPSTTPLDDTSVTNATSVQPTRASAYKRKASSEIQEIETTASSRLSETKPSNTPLEVPSARQSRARSSAKRRRTVNSEDSVVAKPQVEPTVTEEAEDMVCDLPVFPNPPSPVVEDADASNLMDESMVDCSLVSEDNSSWVSINNTHGSTNSASIVDGKTRPRFGGSSNGILNSAQRLTDKGPRPYSVDRQNTKPRIPTSGAITPQFQRKKELDLLKSNHLEEKMRAISEVEQRAKERMMKAEQTRLETLEKKEARRKAVLAKKEAFEQERRKAAWLLLEQNKKKQEAIKREEEKRREQMKKEVEELRKRKEQMMAARQQADVEAARRKAQEELAKKQKEAELERKRKLEELKKVAHENQDPRLQSSHLKTTTPYQQSSVPRLPMSTGSLQSSSKSVLQPASSQYNHPATMSVYEKTVVPPIPHQPPVINQQIPVDNHINDYYAIDDLNSGDETDDEHAPKKSVPLWAKKGSKYIHQWVHSQYTGEKPWWTRFQPSVTIPVDIPRVFKGQKFRVKPRTSSAVWATPPYRFPKTNKSKPSSIQEIQL